MAASFLKMCKKESSIRSTVLSTHQITLDVKGLIRPHSCWTYSELLVMWRRSHVSAMACLPTMVGLPTGVGKVRRLQALYKAFVVFRRNQVGSPPQKQLRSESLATKVRSVRTHELKVQQFSYGDGFNALGGGVYAMDWRATGIRVWSFARGSIPHDILAGVSTTRHWGVVCSLSICNV